MKDRTEVYLVGVLCALILSAIAAGAVLDTYWQKQQCIEAIKSGRPEFVNQVCRPGR